MTLVGLLQSSSRVSPIYTWGGGFVAYAATSLLWSPGDWRLGLAWLGSFVLCFLLGTRLWSLDRVWLLYNLFLLWNLILIPWLPYGVWGNPNYLGCALALGIAGALVHQQPWYLPPLAVGLLYTGSRGAIAAATAAGVIWLWGRS